MNNLLLAFNCKGYYNDFRYALKLKAELFRRSKVILLKELMLNHLCCFSFFREVKSLAKKREEEKTHIFNIWLLREGVSKENVFESCQRLYPDVEQNKIAVVEGAVAFKWQNKQSSGKSWWQKYWNLSGERISSFYNAIIIIPINNRLFVITHGYTNAVINDDITDSGFASSVILNSLDPKKLSTMKVFQPDASIKQLTQISSSRGLIYIPQLGLDPTSILNDLSGKVLKEYEKLFSSVSGGFGKSLKVKSILPLSKIVSFFEELLDISQKETYLENFPNALQLEEVRDKNKIKDLDNELETSLLSKDMFIQLDIPDVTDSFDWYWSLSSDIKTKFPIDDFNCESVMEKLNSTNIGINISSFKDIKISIYESEDSEYSIGDRYSLYRCLSVQLPDEGNDDSYQFHLINSIWYQIDRSLIKSIDMELETNLINKNTLEEFPERKSLKTFSEEAYNELLTLELKGVLLDKTNFAPDNQTAVEPCDVFINKDSNAWFIHTKVYRGSSSLSHLFFQASNSLKLLLTERESNEKLNKLLKMESKDEQINTLNFIDDYSTKINIVLCILVPQTRVTSLSISNLPLFSKIGLSAVIATMKNLRSGIELRIINN